MAASWHLVECPMPTLRADESRYLLQVEPNERPLVRRLPAARWLPEQRVYQLPMREGVILALDRIFGRDGWQPEGDVAVDAEAARGRELDRPRQLARVRLDGTQLGVQCDIGDRELVKLVPGYRWSPADRTWYVPAHPLALEILSDVFGDLLQVEEGALRTLELRAVDDEQKIRAEIAAWERQQEELQAKAQEATAAPPQTPELMVAEAPQTEAHEEFEADPTSGVVERLDRIDATLQRMEALFERVLEAIVEQRGVATSTPPALSPAPTPQEEQHEAPVVDWRSILQQSQENAESALDQANRIIQTTDGEPPRELRAVAGVAAHRAGRSQQAFEHLSEALGRKAELEDAELTRVARDSYTALVFDFLNDDTGPVERLENVAQLRRLLLAELRDSNGFDSERIGSAAARGTLERLVQDEALRGISPELADFCRVAHLLSVVRGGGRMASSLVAGVIGEDSLHADAQALATILFANMLLGEPSQGEWVGRWPAEDSTGSGYNPARLAERALEFLPLLDSEIVPNAALAVLACCALSDEVHLPTRRALVNYIPQASSVRRYGEFLAVYHLASTGQRVPWAQFPGYMHVVSTTPLERSWPHLYESFVADSGAQSAVRAVVDSEAFVQALRTYGITEPEHQLLDLLDLVRTSSRPDNLLNDIARLVEDRGFRGADLLDREQRLRVYRAAFDEAVRMGHDNDARAAFERLVRALQDEPTYEPLRALCAEAMERVRRLRVPALVVLLEVLLDEGADFREAMQSLASMIRGAGDDRDDAEAQILGLQFIYPEFAEEVRALVEEAGVAPAEEPPSTFPGRRIVVVGGRPSMKKRAVPVLEQWGVQVTWLDAADAKTGRQAPAKAAGSSDLVVVNTACIGHAASGRAIDAAKAAGKEPVMQPSNGVGSLLLRLQRELQKLGDEPSTAPERPRKAAELRKKLRR